MTNTIAEHTVLTCPDWCESGKDHIPDDAQIVWDDGGYIMSIDHAGPSFACENSKFSVLVSGTDEGGCWSYDVLVDVPLCLDAAQARELSANLARAAEWLEAHQ